MKLLRERKKALEQANEDEAAIWAAAGVAGAGMDNATGLAAAKKAAPPKTDKKRTADKLSTKLKASEHPMIAVGVCRRVGCTEDHMDPENPDTNLYVNKCGCFAKVAAAASKDASKDTSASKDASEPEPNPKKKRKMHLGNNDLAGLGMAMLHDSRLEDGTSLLSKKQFEDMWGAIAVNIKGMSK
jgi:hypothetical protein